jgi:hypothetical protein
MATGNTQLTALELQGLQAITRSDYYERGRDSIVWDFSVYDICPFRGKTRSGVFSSLVQKGLIVITEGEKKFIKNSDGTKTLNRYWNRDDNNFGTLYITPAGYSLLDSFDMIDENGAFII